MADLKTTFRAATSRTLIESRTVDSRSVVKDKGLFAKTANDPLNFKVKFVFSTQTNQPTSFRMGLSHPPIRILGAGPQPAPFLFS